MLLREHTKKPIAKAELKNQILRDRSDRAGKIMKVVVARANEKLAHIAGLELALDQSPDDDADGARLRSRSLILRNEPPACIPCSPAHRILLPADAGADASQVATQSQAPTQSSKGAAGATKYLLVNKLQGAVTLPPSEASLVYLGFVETVLQLIMRNQGAPPLEPLLRRHLGAPERR